MQIKVIPFPIAWDGDFQFNKKGINKQIAVETKGKHKMFQNQDTLVNLKLKTTMHKNKTKNSNMPTAKNSFRFDIMNSL